MRCILALIGLVPAIALAQQTVSPELFDKMERYTAFSAAAYQDDCGKPPFGSKIVKSVHDAKTDTQATIFRDEAAKEIVLAFRGTSSPKALDSDLAFALVPLTAVGTECSDCKVHSGFQAAYNSIAQPVAELLQGLETCEDDWRLVVTGHSLGGGIGAIATTALVGMGFKVSEIFTFGEPRNGDAQWAKYAASQISDDKYYRVTHANDGVPQIPPVILGYVHHGPEYFQSKDANNTAETTLKCTIDSPECSAGQDFGGTPINHSHLTYSNTIVGSSLFVPACGAVFP